MDQYAKLSKFRIITQIIDIFEIDPEAREAHGLLKTISLPSPVGSYFRVCKTIITQDAIVSQAEISTKFLLTELNNT